MTKVLSVAIQQMSDKATNLFLPYCHQKPSGHNPEASRRTRQPTFPFPTATEKPSMKAKEVGKKKHTSPSTTS